jgi:hypothetical protein
MAAVALLLATAATTGHAQTDERPLTLLLSGTLTIGGELFPNYGSSNPLSRSESIELSSSFGYGGEVRYLFPYTRIAIGVSADYTNSSFERTLDPGGSAPVTVQDGYTATAVELTGYFFIPVSGQTLRLYMGGGGGGYWGKRVYRIASTEAPSLDATPGFGIHVLAGARWQIQEHVAAVFAMKFRDLQFESTNAFSTARIQYRDASINVGTAPFTARIQANGIVFHLGLAFNL